tara:strand:+ start:781 stop:1080 length:300 start_codon:yes stop_codon:yes gene_type:complete
MSNNQSIPLVDAENDKIISILPFLEKEELKKEASEPDNNSEFFTKFNDLNTDDLAGSLLAYYAFDITLFEDVDSKELLEELKDRAIAYLDLYEQIKLKL